MNIMQNLERTQAAVDRALDEFQSEVEKLVTLSNAMAESCNALKARKASRSKFAGFGQKLVNEQALEVDDGAKLPDGVKPDNKLHVVAEGKDGKEASK